ncbi:MAG: glycyl-tRNA synthetase [Candidatus Magasanikbacteria bacterium]|nr:glycyl-tRNA synthetase [Candidatus Magasanikbacteria bacterium]
MKSDLGKNDRMDKLVSLCKRRGFIFPDSEIYGGLANSWDYGPLGVLLKNNLRREWWKFFVTSRADMVGVDSSIIMNPKVWEASGHLGNFSDPLVECKKCHHRFRADHLLESTAIEPKHEKERPRSAAHIKCPDCSGELTETKQFNLMFKTFIGPVEDAGSAAYLRPELAAGMFTNFKNVLDSLRLRLPFGIAQSGRTFRNEITTGNFIFRTREFEIMEFEYFIRPEEWREHFERWLMEIKRWWTEVVGADMGNFYFHEIPDGERAHYSERTVDIEYQYPFGLKELHGLAYRTDFDLKRHMEASGVDLSYRDPVSGEKFIPHCIEPTFGLDRMVLVTLLEHFEEVEGGRSEEGESKHEKEIVLRLPRALAPIQAAVFPLSKKEPLTHLAGDLAQELRAVGFSTQYDETGSIGKRYRRQDEIGTPFCVTVDFETLEDKKVTVRDRDSMAQERVGIGEIVGYFKEKFA